MTASRNDELITLTLSNPVNASVPNSVVTITVLDDDVDQVNIASTPAEEGKQVAITFSLDFAPEVAAGTLISHETIPLAPETAKRVR